MNYWANKNGMTYLNFNGKCIYCGDELNLIKTCYHRSGGMSEDNYTCNRCYKEFIIENWAGKYYRFIEYENDMVIREGECIPVGYFISNYNIYNKIKNLF